MPDSLVPLGLSVLVIATQIGLGIILLLLGLKRFFKKTESVNALLSFWTKHAISIAFLISVVSTVGSLYFSEIEHLAPCTLCWYQRICMYPQVLLLGAGLYLKDKNVKAYVIPLALIGFLIAAYHVYLQTLGIIEACRIGDVSCAVVTNQYFGFVTIPLMSLTAFASILALLFLSHSQPAKKRIQQNKK